MKRKINMKKLDSRSVKAKFIGYDDKSTAYILQEFDSKKVIKARNVIFKENEIQSFSARETMSPDNSNLVSPNMDFEDDRSNDEATKIPVQARGGKMIRHLLFKIHINSKKTQRKMKSHSPEKAEIVAPRNDMDYPTRLTLQKRKTYKNPSRIMKQFVHRMQKTGEKLCKQSTSH